MTLNREQTRIIEAYEAGTLQQLAAEKARRNEQGFTFGWSSEQHLERLTKIAEDLISQQAAEEAKKQQQPATKFNQPRKGWSNTNCGYYGTKRDAARGFDGIE